MFLNIVTRYKITALLWKAIVDKSGQDYFYDPVLSQISPDAFPASQMQVHPSRIDDEQSRTRFHVTKNNDRTRNFHRSRIKFLVVENFSPVENFHQSRIFQRSRIFISREFFISRRHFRAKMLSRGTNKDGVQFCQGYSQEYLW